MQLPGSLTSGQFDFPSGGLAAARMSAPQLCLEGLIASVAAKHWRRGEDASVLVLTVWSAGFLKLQTLRSIAGECAAEL